MIDQKNKFNFFVPIEIVKGTEESNGEMIIEGIASDNGRDFDGEYLDPSGFDFSPLMESGVINWNHRAKDDPDAIIGEPMTARVTENNEFFIRGKLFKGDKKAIDTYNKAITLKKNKSTRQLGWSIEGIATDRDPLNPKRVRKALITGVAITHCPKNSNTFVNIVKGQYNELYIAPETYCPNCTDEQLQNGKCIKCGYLEKDMTTSSLAPTTLESVETDGRLKTLTKSQVYCEIIKNFDINLSKAKDIYNFILAVNNKIHPDMSNTNNKTTVSETALQKSFDILRKSQSAEDLLKDDENVNKIFEKGKDEGGVKEKINTTGDNASLTEEEVEKQIKEGERKDELKKSCETFIEAGVTPEVENSFYEDSIRKGFSLSECQGAWQSVLAEMNSKNMGGDTSELGKSKEMNILLIEEVLEKSLSSVIDRMEQIFIKQSDFLSSRFTAIADIAEQQTEKVSSIQKSFDASVESNSNLLQKIATFQGGRKAFQNVREVPRFEKSKDEGNNNKAEGEVYSLSKSEDREALMQRIEEMPNYGTDQMLQKSVQEIEIAKTLDERTTYKYLTGKGLNIVS